MPILDTVLRNAILQTYSNAVVSGSIIIKDGATTILTYALDGTPFAAPSAGSMALADTPLSAVAAAATTDNGTELIAEWYDNTGTPVRQFTSTVGVTGGPEELLINVAAHATNTSKPNITSGQTVEITSITLNQPAS